MSQLCLKFLHSKLTFQGATCVCPLIDLLASCKRLKIRTPARTPLNHMRVRVRSPLQSAQCNQPPPPPPTQRICICCKDIRTHIALGNLIRGNRTRSRVGGRGWAAHWQAGKLARGCCTLLRARHFPEAAADADAGVQTATGVFCHLPFAICHLPIAICHSPGGRSSPPPPTQSQSQSQWQ